MNRATALQAVLCSHNAHKAHELQELLPMLELEPLPAAVELPPETGTTFEQNARIKARAGAAAAGGRWAIADDSGLCVDALDGAPGIYSARFAGAGASDDDNNAKLLAQLATVDEPERRSARFVCVLVAIAPDGRELLAEGAVEGHVAQSPQGDGGFGYDPLFIPRGYTTTFAALGPEIKQQLSHRARAAASLAVQLHEAAGA